MMKQLAALESWFDGRSARERNVLFAAVLAAILLLFETAWCGPERQRAASAGANVASLQAQKTAMEDEVEVLSLRESLDPDAAILEQLDVLEHKIGALDTRLRNQTLQILSPEQMPAVLKDLIGMGRALRIVGIRSESPQRLVNSANDNLPVLYRHGLVIDLQGEYLALLDYVQALENLPWRFYWLGLEVRAAGSGPREFRLHVYTVSLREEWIRV
jgi:MSHA biogenesis protein MshJ